MRDQEDVKVQQIRRAARKLFLQRGFAGVSTAALAEEAGISKETLYSRFPSKEAVLADVLKHLIAVGDVGEDVPPAVRTHEDLERALGDLAHRIGGALLQREYIELARIVIAETPRLPQIGEVFRNAVPQRAFGLVTQILDAAKDAALTDDFDSMVAARMFIGPLVLYALTNVLLVAPSVSEGAEPISPLDVEPHVKLFLAAISKASNSSELIAQ